MAEIVAQVGEGGRKHRGPQWRTVLIVVAVLVLAGGAGAAARWLMAKHADKTTNTVAKTVDPRPSSVKQADSLLVSGKTEEAAAYVKQQLDKPSLSNTERYELYVEQGLIAQNAEDYQLAADAFGKAFAIKEDYDLAQKLGSTYQQLGDKQKAIDYYKKAIALNPPSNPMRESNNNIFQQMIDQLQAELKQ